MFKLRTITEGLRGGDLKNMISPRFTIDQYKSKMGNDRDIIVLAFSVKEKFSAIDTMEFIEKSYEFVLDADTSSGEEIDGTYRVFVELERDPKAAQKIQEILNGLERLCEIDSWKFCYYKDQTHHNYTIDNAKEIIPLNSVEYQFRIAETKKKFVSEIINQGSANVIRYDHNDRMLISRPFAQPLEFQVEALGAYRQVVDQVKGAIQLDEQSACEVLFLEKFLGNRSIHKINNKFIIQNGNNAIAVSMKR
jgi:hypothetical protein